jgi:SAM-dependent methyltransferase
MEIDELTQYQPDSICSVNVIYSLDNHIQFIKKSYETLAPGGRLILSSQNRGVDLSLLKKDMDFEFSGLPGYHRFLEINQHLVGQSGGRPRTYNLDEMGDICSMAGFSVRNVDDTHYHGCNFTLSAEKHG